MDPPSSHIFKTSKATTRDQTLKRFPFSIKMAQKSASPCTVSPYMDADWHLWMESNHFLPVVQHRFYNITVVPEAIEFTQAKCLETE